MIMKQAYMEKASQTQHITEAIARYLRSVLDQEGEIVTIHQELQQIKNYLDIQELRFGSRFRYQLNCDSQCRSLNVPFMILQPLVENTVTHGVDCCARGIQLCCHIEKEGESVLIYVEDDGPGMTEEKVMAAGNPLNEELKQKILSIDGVTDIIPSRQSLHATYKTEIHQAGGMCDMLTDQNYAAVEAALTEGTMPTDSRSIVIDYNVLKQNEDMGVGSTVEISLGEEQPSVSVTISGLYAPAKVYSGHGRMHLDGATLFAPEALFHELHPEITSFDYSWSIVNDPKKTDYVGAELKNIVASHSNIALDEINTVIEYEEMTNSFAFGSMEILSWLVFLFGVINLINTTLSNQIARKQENSILRSIGLTQKQLCKMNICEGLCYALFATLATLIVGLPASIFACRKMSIGAFAGNVVPYKFPVLEMGLFILVLFGMELILSVWTIRRQKKQSLIEQMRAME